MARHRNVRTMNYDEEYDGYDDVYGHSVEDDLTSSPSMQHFLYDRSQEHQMSAYIQSDIPEEEEELTPEESNNVADVGAPPRIPPLGELEQAQLYSCLDLLRDRMGDALSEQEGINAILAANFDAEKALDQLLRNSVPSTLKKVSKSAIPEKTVPAMQDIKPNVSTDKISLNQLATLHLSKNNPAVERSTLNLMSNFKSNLVASNISVTNPLSTKPKLADLAKISLGNPNLSKSIGSNTVRPSLSELARVSLQPQNLSGGYALRLRNSIQSNKVLVSTNVPSEISEYDGASLNLTLALRSKCSVVEGRKRIPSESVSEMLPDFSMTSDSSPLDMQLVCCKASPLGRVIVANGLQSKTLFQKFQPSVMALNGSVTINPFDFTSPSPDDLVRSRLRGN